LAQNFHPPQLLAAHGCPLHGNLLLEVAAQGTFLMRTKGDIVTEVQQHEYKSCRWKGIGGEGLKVARWEKRQLRDERRKKLTTDSPQLTA
jgi:hypothetical protein